VSVDDYLESLLRAFLVALRDHDHGYDRPTISYPGPSYDPGGYVGSGTLPRTGVGLGGLAALAMGLIAAGSTCVVFARRRVTT
jgi:LPXTG-motif cell wall-anchored protein